MLPKSRLTPIMALYLLPAVFLTACGGGGANSGPISPSASNWLIPVDEVIDGGPGKDGIPAIDAPRFQPISLNVDSDPDGLIVGVLLDGEAKAFPRDILNWHEIVNDRTGQTPMILNYCPLTGTGMAWYADPTATRQTFGVSGLLYNSNLILYDRETDSNWSQMLEMSVEGVMGSVGRTAISPETWHSMT